MGDVRSSRFSEKLVFIKEYSLFTPWQISLNFIIAFFFKYLFSIFYLNKRVNNCFHHCIHFNIVLYFLLKFSSEYCHTLHLLASLTSCILLSLEYFQYFGLVFVVLFSNYGCMLQRKPTGKYLIYFFTAWSLTWICNIYYYKFLTDKY